MTIHISADECPVFVGTTVYIRIGNCHPKPGRWKCLTMVVNSISRTGRLELTPAGTLRCERMPGEVFVDPKVARGEIPEPKKPRPKNPS